MTEWLIYSYFWPLRSRKWPILFDGYLQEYAKPQSGTGAIWKIYSLPFQRIQASFGKRGASVLKLRVNTGPKMAKSGIPDGHGHGKTRQIKKVRALYYVNFLPQIQWRAWNFQKRALRASKMRFLIFIEITGSFWDPFLNGRLRPLVKGPGHFFLARTSLYEPNKRPMWFFPKKNFLVLDRWFQPLK